MHPAARFWNVVDKHYAAAAFARALARIPGAAVDLEALSLAKYRKRADLDASIADTAAARRAIIDAILACTAAAAPTPT